MKASTVIILAAGALGAPLWVLPDAKAVLGANLFYGLAATACAVFGAGLWRWYRDGE